MVRVFVATAVLVLSGLSAQSASASATSTARITSPPDVHPGARTYTLSVTNTEPGLLGTTINAIRVTLPTSSAGLTSSQEPASCGGFNQTKVTRAVGGDVLDFREGSLRPGATTTCSIPVDVARPQRSDRSGDVVVHVSSDDLATTRRASTGADGTLTTSVRVLEIVTGSLRPTAPTSPDGALGVTDRSGTSGQVVTYAFGVRNHAREQIDVTPALTVSSAVEEPGTGRTATVAPDSPTEFTVPLTLGDVPSGSQRSVTVTAGATAPGATATEVDDPFTVQGPVTFGVSNLRRVRANGTTDQQMSTCSGCRFVVTLDLTKTGVQTVHALRSELRFGGNRAVGQEVAVPAGSRTTSMEYVFADVRGEDGTYDLELALDSTDGNLATTTGLLRPGPVTVDSRATVVWQMHESHGQDADGDARTAATHGTVSVSGGLSGEPVDLATLRAYVVEGGREREMNVTSSRSSDRSATWQASLDVTWPPATVEYRIKVVVEDLAGNAAVHIGPQRAVDTAPPQLTEPGVVLGPRVVGLEWRDATGIRGGCDPGAYLIDGIPGRVKTVTDSTGAPSGGNCNPRTSTADGARLLHLADGYSIAPGAFPTVTYQPLPRLLGFRPVKDGAGNEAPRQTVRTAGQATPAAPSSSASTTHGHHLVPAG